MSRHICITGCTKGLGRALVDWFLEHGWAVSGCGRDADAILELVDSKPRDRVHFERVDVTDDAAVGLFAAEVEATLGTPELLLNNAGIINANAPLWEVPAKEFSQVVDVNIKGVANVLRHFAPMMIAKGRGVMVNLSSGWGRSTSPEVAPYCATKWAVEGLSQAMAQELPAGVAVAAMNPGIIDTAMLRSCFGEGARGYGKASDWAMRAGPFLSELDASCNGRQLTAP
ncbi:SDR family oxidoreductase [Pelagicoccus sp. NFK12]|uniref:SDR family oxidoreductase n=1 Tax=Pelagicoccus enzymogenes TaxID=2773457 RepID=A0A927IK39_9BACT|nr:SDR family oxidoreductase [Pelagicoccus enzymogenes]MBD5782205.1 SDR family oxidoreductase [Pelagicoccus enzymogenes]MDQ8198778.1 SDR family NAD(P)-dependent oxidoreductase [Pelagicoccus enzymogenes]